MKVKAKFLGREKMAARLRRLVPGVEGETAAAQLEAAKELAAAIAARAPTGRSGNYRSSIEGDRIADRPGVQTIGIRATKDPNATGIFADFMWRFLEFGTAPHAQPNNPRIGYFHPGSKAQPHVFPTYRAMKKRIRRKVAKALNAAVRKSRKV